MENVRGPRKIRALMVLHEVTNKMIADQEGVTPEYVSYVINGRNVGYRIRKAIAAAVGCPIEDLWEDGKTERRAA